MSRLQKVRIVTTGVSTHVFLDDHEVCGCVGAEVEYAVGCAPVVMLRLHATDLEIEADCAMVEQVVADT